MAQTVHIGNVAVEPGRRRRIEIPISRLPTETWLALEVEVVNGLRLGPRLWLSSAVHGDEVNGIEIIRRVLERLDPEDMAGCVVAVPIVNVFGFINQSRYLPDRRDLNRSFPGSTRGSMASRLANLFMTEVVAGCAYGIDFHTGSHHRANLPQIRADLRDVETRRIAEAFAAPVVVDTRTRDGSLRQAATQQGICTLLYEAGEPLRFDERAIEVGVEGTLRVLNALKIRKHTRRKKRGSTTVFEKSTWVRARRSGLLRLQIELGQEVHRRQRLGVIADAFGDNTISVRAPAAGVVIGLTNNPLVHQGDGIVHIAQRVAHPVPEYGPNV